MPRSNRLAGLGELQLAVLDHLSHLREGTVYDVLAQFPTSKRPRYTTILTVLRTLEEKGLVTHTKRERQFVFRPCEEAQQVRGRVLREVLDRVFGGSPRQLVSALLDSEEVTPEVVRELKRLLAQKEKRRERK